MKNLLIGLLVVAAGAGVYFFVLKKKEKGNEITINKEQLIGKWKGIGGLSTSDDVAPVYYSFGENGAVISSVNDSLILDTSYYSWSKGNQVVWKQKANDSAGKTFTVLKLTTDTLQMQEKDSNAIFFVHLK